VLIGVFVVVRRTVHLVPILINHQWLPHARYPTLTLIHILTALLFLVLAPLQFNQTFRQRHPQSHRRAGRVQV